MLSDSQQQFWTLWQPQVALPEKVDLKRGEVADPIPPSAKGAQLQQAIAPYLSSQQLMVIPQGKPVRVLYAETRGQRRVYQVVFRDRATKRGFQVQAKLTLDATPNGLLQQLLTESPGTFPETELMLTMAKWGVTQSRQARGAFFEDTIALIMAAPPSKHGRPRPVSVPLRALIPQKTEGFLCVSQPGCDAALRPFFRQPKAQWALGEAAGHVAAKVLTAERNLSDWMKYPRWRWQLQQQLVQRRIPLFAFNDVGLDDPDFEAIQMGAIANVVRTNRSRDLSFHPETPVTRSVVASALMRLPGNPSAAAMNVNQPLQDVSRNHWAFAAIQNVIALGVMQPDAEKNFFPNRVLSKRQLWEVLSPLYPPDVVLPSLLQNETPARRRHLSRGLYPILQARLGLYPEAKMV
ncbi:MAG: hypothetical protein F6K42_36480 [Leptolyngbya sp. SIO1D8]|nr:hypothetical protein [Leptolyngbya sp. SIO1D8]